MLLLAEEEEKGYFSLRFAVVVAVAVAGNESQQKQSGETETGAYDQLKSARQKHTHVQRKKRREEENVCCRRRCTMLLYSSGDGGGNEMTVQSLWIQQQQRQQRTVCTRERGERKRAQSHNSVATLSLLFSRFLSLVIRLSVCVSVCVLALSSSS